MKVILNDPIDMLIAISMVEEFKERLPDDHRDCVFVSEGIHTYVKRTKAGNIVVSQWKV